MYVRPTFLFLQEKDSRQVVGKGGETRRWGWRRWQWHQQEVEGIHEERVGRKRGRVRARAGAPRFLPAGREAGRDRDQDKPLPGDGALGDGAFPSLLAFNTLGFAILPGSSQPKPCCLAP